MGADGKQAEKTVEQQYEELRKKLPLPAFAQVNADFDLEGLDADSLTVKDVRKKVSEKLDHAAKLLEEVLQPDTHIASMYEARAFDEDEKRVIFSIYRALMRLYRKDSELSISSEEAEDAAFIIEVAEFWSRTKGELKKVMRRLQEIWETEAEQESDLGYMG